MRSWRPSVPSILAITLLGVLTVFPVVVAAGRTSPGAEATPILDQSKLDDVAVFLEARRTDLGLPGMAAAIVHGDQIVFSRGFGTAGGGTPVEPTTPFMIASISKSVTALAVLQQVDEGRVDLDSPVTAYLPELAPGGDSLSVRDFMHHRTGLTTSIGRASWVGTAGSSLEANVARLEPHLKSIAPHEYSNANYDVLALVVERVTGTPYADYLHTNVYGPLEMTSSTADRSVAEALGMAQGHYHWVLFGYRPHDAATPSGMAGSASTFSSAEDLAHLLIAHLNGGVYRGTRIVSEESLAVLHNPRPYGIGPYPGYAGGLRVSPSFRSEVGPELASMVTLWHSGTWSNYQGVVWMMPEADLGFVVLANGIDLAEDAQITQVAQGVKHLLFDLEPREIFSVTDLLVRWSKPLLLVLVLAQLAMAVVAVGTIRRIFEGRPIQARHWAALGVATALDLTALWLLVAVIPTAGETPIRVMFGQFPDYRLLIIGMALGITWGLMRTVVVAIGVYRMRSSPRAAS